MIQKLISEFWLTILQIFLAIISVILLPTLINSNNVNGNISLLIEVSVWIILLVAPITLQLSQIKKDLASLNIQKKKEIKFIAYSEECDKELTRIQSYYSDIQALERGFLIQNALLQQLESLRNIAENYVRHGALEEVIPNQSTTKPLLLSLNPKDEFRFVHYADNNDFLFNSHSLDFMKEVVQKIESGDTGKARRIIVITSNDELLDPRLWLFLLFHQDHPFYNYRLIYKSDYEDLQSEHDLIPSRMDFGIYGNKYAYQSSQVPTDHHDLHSTKPIGLFIAKQEIINNLIVFFDHCWESYESWILPNKFFSVIRRGIVLPTGIQGGVFNRKKIITVDALISSGKLSQSLKTTFDKSDLTLEALLHPNR